MRRRDKSLNIEKANLLAEQRYLKSRGLLKEDLSDDLSGEYSFKTDSGSVVAGAVRMRPEQLSLQIGRNAYFSFWEGEFQRGGVKIVAGTDEQSQAWLDQATKVYDAAERKSYPEKYAESEGSRKIIIKSRDDWAREINNLKPKGYTFKSQHELDPERDFVSMHNYAKYPYEIIINDNAKTVEFGEHTINTTK